jgi:DNA-binding GntR family transcriptional regulator
MYFVVYNPLLPVPSLPASFHRAYDHLVRKIASGDLAAGSPLSEVALATEIGVSRTPVREAIGQLAAEGILQKISGRGTVVAEPTRQDIVDLYELREALEVYAVGHVARRGLKPDESTLLGQLVDEIAAVKDRLVRSGKTTLSGDLLQRFLAADLRFHTVLLQAAGNRRMSKVLGDTRLLLRIFTMRREDHTAALLTQVQRYHRRILEAVTHGNGPKAAQLLGEHIQASLQERLAEYEAHWRATEQTHLLRGL